MEGLTEFLGEDKEKIGKINSDNMNRLKEDISMIEMKLVLRALRLESSGGPKGITARLGSNQLSYLNTHSINCVPADVTAVTAVPPPELLHGPILSPQTSQIQFPPISRGSINWSV